MEKKYIYVKPHLIKKNLITIKFQKPLIKETYPKDINSKIKNRMRKDYHHRQNNQNKGSSSKAPPAYAHRSFISGYTPHQMTLKQLTNSLKKHFPHIDNVTMPYRSKMWQGYGFAEFSNKDDFLKFLKLKRLRLEKYEMNLVIKPQKKGRALKNFIKDFKKRRVLVNGVPGSWTDRDLEDFFLQFGKLENAYILKNDDPASFNSEGIVAFLAKKDAIRCYEQEELTLPGGHVIYVEHYKGKDITNMNESEPLNYQEGGEFYIRRDNLNKFKKSREQIRSKNGSNCFNGEDIDFVKMEILSISDHRMRPTDSEYHKRERELEQRHKDFGNIRLNRPLVKKIKSKKNAKYYFLGKGSESYLSRKGF